MTGKRSGSSSRWEPYRRTAKKNRRNARDEEDSEQGGGNPVVSAIQDGILSSDDEERSDNEQENSQGGPPKRRGEEVRVKERARRNRDGNDEEASLRGSMVDNNDEISTNSTTRTNTPPPTRMPSGNVANIVTVHRNGSTRQQEGTHLFEDSQLDEKKMHNWQLSIKDKVRNEIFYMKQFAKEGSEYGSIFQKLLCNKAVVPVEVQARYWDSRGRKIAKQALAK